MGGTLTGWPFSAAFEMAVATAGDCVIPLTCPGLESHEAADSDQTDQEQYPDHTKYETITKHFYLQRIIELPVFLPQIYQFIVEELCMALSEIVETVYGKHKNQDQLLISPMF